MKSNSNGWDRLSPQPKPRIPVSRLKGGWVSHYDMAEEWNITNDGAKDRMDSLCRLGIAKKRYIIGESGQFTCVYANMDEKTQPRNCLPKHNAKVPVVIKSVPRRLYVEFKIACMNNGKKPPDVISDFLSEYVSLAKST